MWVLRIWTQFLMFAAYTLFTESSAPPCRAFWRIHLFRHHHVSFFSSLAADENANGDNKIPRRREKNWNWNCNSSRGWRAIRKVNISFLNNYIQGKMYIGSSMRAFLMLYWYFMKINIVKEAGFPFLVIDSGSCWLRDLEPECWLFHRPYGKCLDHNRQCW